MQLIYVKILTDFVKRSLTTKDLNDTYGVLIGNLNIFNKDSLPIEIQKEFLESYDIFKEKFQYLESE